MFKLNQETKDDLKLLGIGLLAALILFMVTNWDFFWLNIKYEFDRPKVASPTVTVKNSQPKSDPNILTIPSLGIKAPVQYATQATEKDFQAQLLNGVVHYPGTAQAGQVGNDYIFGHSSDYIWSKGHYKTIFAVLPKIQIGAEVFLSDASGNLYTYKVTSLEIVLPSDLSVLSQNTNGKKILTVQTSYPVGTALKRFVAICQLVQ